MRHFINIVESKLVDGISKIKRGDYEQILALVETEFRRHMDNVVKYVDAVTDWNTSYKLVHDGKIVGAYLLCPADVCEYQKYCWEDLSQYENKRGVEGVALVLDPEYRGTGLGKQLIDLPKRLGYDYIFGQHLESLQNLGHWLKRRRLIGKYGEDGGTVYLTLADLS